jgi:hypothetical protein
MVRNHIGINEIETERIGKRISEELVLSTDYQQS